jgi:dipeptidyl aminopeptidase/acylaminoacyl peptidase/tRNA A-37 threonylcarbamoyl transferase component Bud32
MTLASGVRLGPYEILSPLGAGGMGEVYKARDSKLNREVAIKVLPESLAKDADALARFEREAHAVAALNHPNILSIHDFSESNGVVFAVTELLDGESLRARLDGGPLSPRKAVDYAIQILRGLAAAHEKGIVHRDLKPENLFVTADGRVKILDFGLARVVSPESVRTNAPTTPVGTEPGTVMGTVGYMSPEQVRGKPADHRSDIFSFGVVLYEMLSGKRAFQRESAAETMAAIAREDPPELSESGRNVPPALDRIVRHCLEKSPSERAQSAHDLAFELESASNVSTQSGKAVGVAASGPRRLGRRIAAVAAGAALLVAGYFAGGRRSPQPVPSFSRLTFRPQFVTNARFTADGKTVVFSAAPDGNRNELFIKDAQSLQARSLSLPDTRLLAVSSRGELAVLTQARYLYQRVYLGTLARMPIGEASPRELLKDVHEADWSPDGSELAIVRRVEGKDRLEYPIGKVLATIGGYFSDVRVSPDGNRIAFMRHPVDSDNRGDVEIIDRSGRLVARSPEFSGEEGVAWLPGGKEVLFSPAGEGGADLTVRALDPGGRVRTVLVNSESLAVFDVAPDGRILVCAGTTRASVIFGTAGNPGERDLSLYDYSTASSISRDGKTVVFSDDTAAAGPYYSVCLRKTDGSPVVRLGEGNALDLSSDGKSVLAAVFSTPPRLMVYPTGAGEPRNISFPRFESYDTGQFFHGDARILFCGVRAGESSRCYVADAKGGEPRPVTPGGTTDGRISPDEASVVAKLGSSGAGIYSLAGGSPRLLPQLAPEDMVTGWSADGRSLTLYHQTLVPTRLERLDLATGERTLLQEVGPADRAGVAVIAPVLLSADEKSYAYSLFRQAGYLFTVAGTR